MEMKPAFITLFLLCAGASPLFGEQLLEVPEAPDASTVRVQLAYVESEDSIAGTTYAYLAYLERDVESGEWSAEVIGNRTGGTTFKPAHPVFTRKCREAATSGERYWIHGFSMSPRPSDPRAVEHRIYVDSKGNPLYLELYLVTRNPDSSAREPATAGAPWPVVF